MKKLLTAVLLVGLAILNTGCSIQKSLSNNTAVVTGYVKVPEGQIVSGCTVTVAGNTSISASVAESGAYTLKIPDSGKYLLVARGQNFDVNYVWVDAVEKETVKAADIELDQKITGEGLWIATTIDFPKAVSFSVAASSPTWSDSPAAMYDDGTHGDKDAGDGIFTLRRTNMICGHQLYSFQYTDADGNTTSNQKDPLAEATYNSKSKLYIPESTVKQVKGKVTSSLSSENYSAVTLATKKGSRTMKLDSDGSFVFAMEGSGKEYLVFRGSSFNIRVIPVDLSSSIVLELADTTLYPKESGQLTVMLVASDFTDVSDPTVVGSFNNWQPQKLYDDGTNGDEVAGDGVYSYQYTGLNAGTYQYAFNVNSSNQVKDPYEESGDSTYSNILVK